ncbi:DUF3231 family protein [Paenactinomyces guangxiensis]|uniref:DUF3231 family protein n=1 Tax=Paenactinomyces guangxiensis TaxID=1490290 RepID=A0A7W2A6M7_9BACL|nr:DUF3231 family protein [Paenactinomyces guangxiensis]MBA4493546.1 DUF3231 family protein [Paenactinomyces guangxiensis]MBH8590637.1 DUF3231 family protein [Paenactinomyces guangxiensis]
MGVLSGNQKNEPLHYGEVFAIHSALAGSQGLIAAYQVMINHSGDGDLRNFLEDLIENKIRPEIEKFQEVLKANEIALPPAPPERPKADLESIPVGARFNDNEIALKVGAELGAGLVAYSQAMATATREDIAMMFGQFHMIKSQYLGKLLKLLKKKGWLIPPPLHMNPEV